MQIEAYKVVKNNDHIHYLSSAAHSCRGSVAWLHIARVFIIY